jgi:hypothetical protein
MKNLPTAEKITAEAIAHLKGEVTADDGPVIQLSREDS